MDKSNEQLGKELAEKAGLRIIADRTAESTDRNNYFIFRLGALCESLDAIAEIERIVISRGDTVAHEYAGRLTAIVRAGRLSYPRYEVITASARQRAEACLLALSTEKI